MAKGEVLAILGNRYRERVRVGLSKEATETYTYGGRQGRASSRTTQMAHDGGTAEGTLNFGKAGDRVVLGNLDGL
jgi:hypothetical protein